METAKEYVWSSLPCKGKVPPARSAHTCLVIEKGKILVQGGCDAGRDLADAYVLDMLTMKWKRVWKLEHGVGTLVGHQAILLNQGEQYFQEYVLMFGGWNGSAYVNLAYLFDTHVFEMVKGDLKSQEHCPKPRKDHTFTYSPYDDKAYLVGGWNPSEWNNTYTEFEDVWSLNSDWEWTKEELYGSPPCARRGHSCVYSALPHPCLIIFGGVYGYGRYMGDMYILELEKRKWTKVDLDETEKSHPPAVAWHSASVLAKHMFVIGGISGLKTYNTEVHALDLESTKWRRLEVAGPGFSPRYSHSAVVFGDQILILGGIGTDGPGESMFGLSEIVVFQTKEGLSRKVDPGKELAVKTQSPKTKRRQMLDSQGEERLLRRFMRYDYSAGHSGDLLTSEYYLPKLELKFQPTAFGPLEPKNIRSIEELRRAKEKAMRWNPLDFTAASLEEQKLALGSLNRDFNASVLTPTGPPGERLEGRTNLKFLSFVVQPSDRLSSGSDGKGGNSKTVI